MKHYLVIKRFGMDDVPVFLTHDSAKAEAEAAEIAVEIDNKRPVFATTDEQELMDVNIRTPLVAAGIITFGDDGRPEIGGD